MELPENDFSDMQILYDAFHLNSDKVTSCMSADRIIKLATPVNKYDYSKALKFVSDKWLTVLTGSYGHYRSKTPAQRWAQLSDAAYYLNQPDHFRYFTKKTDLRHPYQSCTVSLSALHSVDTYRHRTLDELFMTVNVDLGISMVFLELSWREWIVVWAHT